MKWKARGVAGDELDTATAVTAKAARAVSAGSRGLGRRRGQHVGAEVRADHPPRALARELQREIARAGRNVEREAARRPHQRGRLPAPSPVEAHRHQAVDEVVARHDAREHRAHEGRLAGGTAGAAGQGGVRGAGVVRDRWRQIAHIITRRAHRVRGTRAEKPARVPRIAMHPSIMKVGNCHAALNPRHTQPTYVAVDPRRGRPASQSTRAGCAGAGRKCRRVSPGCHRRGCARIAPRLMRGARR